MSVALRIRVALVNAVCYPAVWWLTRADRNVCRWSNETDDESCEVCGSDDVQRRGDWDYCVVGHIYVGKRAGLSS